MTAKIWGFAEWFYNISNTKNILNVLNVLEIYVKAVNSEQFLFKNERKSKHLNVFINFTFLTAKILGVAKCIYNILNPQSCHY